MAWSRRQSSARLIAKCRLKFVMGDCGHISQLEVCGEACWRIGNLRRLQTCLTSRLQICGLKTCSIWQTGNLQAGDLLNLADCNFVGSKPARQLSVGRQAGDL